MSGNESQAELLNNLAGYDGPHTSWSERAVDLIEECLLEDPSLTFTKEALESVLEATKQETDYTPSIFLSAIALAATVIFWL